ncbi:Mitochondrial transcription termination factor family protein [Forsythia ovata]|uniref:Mitochondrial transcription termination factor family protein n=1 Tax=Forsythia ovata TaxID=205694 RepID=A0ABD1P5U2_9LAMI
MFNSVHKVFLHGIGRSSVRIISQNPKSRFVQLNSFNSFASAATNTQKPISKNENQENFTVNYLMNTWGFSPEKALSASKYVNFDSTEKPDSVVSLWKSHGFTTEQIENMVKRFPPIITCDPQKTLLPKIEFFRSLGMPESDVVSILCGTPTIFKRSLEKQIIPSYNYIKSLFESNGKSLGSMKRLAEILCCDRQSQLLPNIEVLREAGVPELKIVALLQYQPRTLMVEREKFKKVVEQVKELGFRPASLKFILAVHAFRSMNKKTWEKKVELYKKWGWSEGEIILAFERHPYCMMISTDKITAIMDFLINKMGFESSVLLKRPALLSFSLGNRIIPRCSVYKVLLEKGLINKGKYLISMLESTEKEFLQRFVQRYEGEAPGLLKLYEKELALSKS